jgi:hypothetical protein
MNGGELEGQRVLESRTSAQILSDQHVPFAVTQVTTQVQGLTWRLYSGTGTWCCVGAWEEEIRDLHSHRVSARVTVVVL